MITLHESKRYKMLGIFPTPLMIFNIRELSEEEIKVLDTLASDPSLIYSPAGNNKTNSTYILENDNLKSLKNEFLDCITIFDREIYMHTNNIKYDVTQSWLNVYEKGSFQNKHIHPNSVLSAVYYYKTVEEDVICFSNHYWDTKIFPVFNVEPENQSIFNSASIYIPAKQGCLVVFQSDLLHYVPSKPTDGKRISLAFNTKISGTIGHHRALTICEL